MKSLSAAMAAAPLLPPAQRLLAVACCFVTPKRISVDIPRLSMISLQVKLSPLRNAVHPPSVRGAAPRAVANPPFVMAQEKSATPKHVTDMLWFQRHRRRLRVWHRAVTRAAEEGGTDLAAAALAAQEERHGWLVLCPDLRHEELRHPCSVGEEPSVIGMPVEAAVPCSPFPAGTEFGILPYAAWHGHLEVVRAFIEAGAPLEATAMVRACSVFKRLRRARSMRVEQGCGLLPAAPGAVPASLRRVQSAGAVRRWPTAPACPLPPLAGGDAALRAQVGAAGPAAEPRPDALLRRRHVGPAGGYGAAGRGLPSEQHSAATGHSMAQRTIPRALPQALSPACSLPLRGAQWRVVCRPAVAWAERADALCCAQARRAARWLRAPFPHVPCPAEGRRHGGAAAGGGRPRAAPAPPGRHPPGARHAVRRQGGRGWAARAAPLLKHWLVRASTGAWLLC